MRLKHITFTGIDAKTDIQDLIDIQREFPIAEFGVLTSYHWNENGNRYLNPAFLSNLYAGNGELNLALHVCGSAAPTAAIIPTVWPVRRLTAMQRSSSSSAPAMQHSMSTACG